jgi:hypothetical protein
LREGNRYRKQRKSMWKKSGKGERKGEEEGGKGKDGERRGKSGNKIG